jgi:hypothetical protein
MINITTIDPIQKTDTSHCPFITKASSYHFILVNSVKFTKRRFSQVLHDTYSSESLPAIEPTCLSTNYNETMNGWMSYIRSMFYGFSEVKSIYYAIDDSDIDIWLIIPKRDFPLLRRLVDAEMGILKMFYDVDRPIYSFEFHIVYLHDALETDIVPKNALRIPKIR